MKVMELVAGLLTGWGAIVLAVVMALTVKLKWPSWLSYVWAALVLVSGILSM